MVRHSQQLALQDLHWQSAGTLTLSPSTLQEETPPPSTLEPSPTGASLFSPLLMCWPRFMYFTVSTSPQLTSSVLLWSPTSDTAFQAALWSTGGSREP